MTKQYDMLSPRELQVVELIGQDFKYIDIADELGISFETVRTYVARIRKKLQVRSKLSIALWAKQQGLLDE